MASQCDHGPVTPWLAAVALTAALAGSDCAAPTATGAAPSAFAGQPSASAVTAQRTAAAVSRPAIKWRPIPFGQARKRQMARYSEHHYGRSEWRLQPRGVVQHYTATNSLASVFATFSANQPDPELGERPGVCTHFVIDRDGTIYQLVSLRIRCRHAVGLNHRMIGIEHVGTSDAAVMGNRRQRRASLRLTTWLLARFGIAVGDVIGHNESLRSRFHRERYRPWRCQTHGDFAPATMNRYRELLRVRAARAGLDTSPPRWRRSHC